MYNPFNKSSVKKQAIRSEKRLAKKVGGFRTPASGAAGISGDVRVGEWLIELKETGKKSFPLTTKVLMKLCKEADGAGKEPLLIVQFNGLAAINNTWVVMPFRCARMPPKTR